MKQLAIVIVLLLGTPALSKESAGMVGITLDTSRRYQVIEGFGASGAWWPTWVDDFPREDQLRMLRLLFTDEGAGLNIYRYNIPAGGGESVTDPHRRTPSIETAPGQYNFDADATGIGFLRDVRELGVERFVLFANSPPARMTRNGQTSGGDEGGSNLKPEAAEDFARYLADVTEHLKSELDLPHVTLSPINEPQWDWGKDRRHQEGCHYTPEETARTIRAVVDEVRRRDMDIRIEAPESGAWDRSAEYAEALFSDPVLDEAIGTFAEHSYWSRPRHKREFVSWFNEKYPGKTISMTEYCQMEGIHNPGMDGGLHLAGVMHDDLTIGSVVTWQWWLAIATGGYADGLIYANPSTKQIEVTKRLWVMGHYARFVKPGYQRVGIMTDQESVKATAYLSPDGGTVAVVLINDTEDSMMLHFGDAGTGFSVPAGCWITTQDRDLQPYPIDEGRIDMPARSIATVVLRALGLNFLQYPHDSK